MTQEQIYKEDECMKEEEWNDIDKKIYKFDQYYCAFLDILGYKEKLNQFFQNKYNLYERFKRAMSSAGAKIGKEYPSGINTYAFSDSIIITAPQKENNLILLIDYVSAIVAYFSYEGLFIRGGISSGKLMEDREIPFLASEGLVKAYELEKQAIYPMIVVDNELIQNNLDPNSPTLKKYIIKNGNRYIVNHVRYIINESANNEQEAAKELDEMIRTKNNIKDPKVKEKHNWLINYYLWFIEESNKKFSKFNQSLFSTFQKERDPRFMFSEI
ncbi:hypothetical protein CAPGI0001_1353 [Capnocytophaga gingivalis ATCC 33624]|uniref:hypothetical protein n=1 Tax=Capnocytophaga gingivalis TaxID=1017 RepID=UPI00019FA366|nr:hypothetical protein [Capnocytophaga gingivalis]EEK14937.1 hypothetical protein CAPGI0001_1353 [Capnocytophaga gingivalis ATCC 33624]